MRRPTQTLRWMAAQRGRRRSNQFALFARNGHAGNSSQALAAILDPLKAENCLVPRRLPTDLSIGASPADSTADEGTSTFDQRT